MKAVNPYLNFDGDTEEAFQFYQNVFGGELMINRMSEVPGMEIPEDEKNRIMHVSLPLSNGQILMGSDILPSVGHSLTVGNNNYISITTDSRAETDELFNKLSEGGTIEMALEDMFWGDYFGSFKDKYGVGWMLAFSDQPA